MRENTIERVATLLTYDQTTGIFTWKVAKGRVHKGSPAGAVLSNGYIGIRIDGVRYLAHRLAWLLIHGEWPQGEIDHINGSRHDNRIENLRDVPRSLNQQNQTRPQSSNTTGALGVSRADAKGRFRARIFNDGRQHHLGTFKTVEEASQAYVFAKRQMHRGGVI
ncbi:hypothetical protein LMG10661_01872 [Ralstonia syzygii subsp. syzygii]|nr:hypothetical protein LMG10661_01872 [Ralstonia syzygii subsp. syzygii]